MTMSFEAPPVDVSERAGSLARRLLGGAGAASLDAYRLGLSLPFVAHGMTSDGVLVVAAHADAMRGADGPTDVRLDVVRQTGDATLPVIASSIHVLGRLTWLDEEAARSLGLPDLVADLVGVPGVSLGAIAVGRAVLHDMHGATVIDPTDLFREPRLDDHAGYTAVASHDQAALSDLCWAVMVGAVPGEVVSKGPLPGVCAHTAERVHCVDVDPYGVTLMLAGAEETLIVFAAFGAGAGEPTVRVARLLEGVAVAAA